MVRQSRILVNHGGLEGGSCNDLLSKIQTARQQHMLTDAGTEIETI